MVSRTSNATRIAAVILVGGTVSACEIQRAHEASDAKAIMVGMSREEVLSCMGSPVSAAKAGETEVWAYNSGNNRTDSFGLVHGSGDRGWFSGFGSMTSESRSCKIDVVMKDGRVSRLNYTGPTGGLITKDEQCAFAVDVCVQDRAALSTASVDDLPSTPSGIPPSDAVATPSNDSQSGTANGAVAQKGCTKEERRTAQLARANGYQYAGNCSSK